MSLLDFILNIACLLLWVSWRYVPFDPINRAKPATLTGTLRRAEPLRIRRWHFLAALIGLVLVRAVFYWWVGGALDWAPGIKIGAISISFRSDLFWRILLFSIGSFANALVLFYLSLIALWLPGAKIADTDPCHRFIRIQLSPLHRWPKGWVGMFPFLVTFTIWLGVGLLLGKWQIIPPVQSSRHLIEQAVVLGLSIYPVAKHVIGAVLALHLLNTYVYLGSHPAWNFINATGKRLLTPLSWIQTRLGKMDFAPLLGIALTYVIAQLAERGLSWLFGRLPF